MKGRPPRDIQACKVFSDNLVRVMAEKRCQAIHLSEDADISVSTISRLRNGKQYPNSLTLKKISSALDVSMNELVD